MADLILVALLTGAWRALERRVGHGLELEASRAERPSASELDSALTQFRYERRLIAGAELRAWLAGRSLRLTDLQGVLCRRWLLGRFDDRPSGRAKPDGLVGALAAEAICAGTLLEAAATLRGWHAGCVAIAAGVARADEVEVERLVAAALADVASGLPALGSQELRRRIERLAALRVGYGIFGATAISDREVDARVAERRLDWTVVTGVELSFALEGAARETRLCVVQDGSTLGDMAQALGLATVRRDLELGSVPGPLRAQLLPAQAGDLVGPWLEEGLWRVLQLERRCEPLAGRDAPARLHARGELLSELLERVSADKAVVVGAC